MTGASIADWHWALLAQASSRAVWSWWWLWLTLLIISILLIGTIAMLSGRRRLGAMPPRQRRRVIKDAWAEAGQRASPLPPEEFVSPDEDEEGDSPDELGGPDPGDDTP
jgi:hypothetical protein